jgi:hypothetical protein
MHNHLQTIYLFCNYLRPFSKHSLTLARWNLLCSSILSSQFIFASDEVSWEDKSKYGMVFLVLASLFLGYIIVSVGIQAVQQKKSLTVQRKEITLLHVTSNLQANLGSGAVGNVIVVNKNDVQ